MTISKESEAEILRLYYAERWKVNTIADQLGVHHSTVERVLNENGVAADRLKIRPSIADPYMPFIRETLEKYPKLNATRIYRMVKERGYPGGVDHFRDIIARHRPRPASEAYLNLMTLPGEQAQVDWGSFGKLKVGDHERKLYAFVMVLSYSRHMFVKFYLNQGTGNFLRGHNDAFEFFGGVSREVLYDNLKSVVLERLDRAVRFNPEILAFASHYKYKPLPVEQGKPNKKGKVERGIKYVRTSFFAGKQWNSLEDLNAQARNWTIEEAAKRPWSRDGKSTVQEVFEREREKLLPLPDAPFPVFDRKPVHIGKTPYVAFDANEYSVPHEYVRRTLAVAATLHEVLILDGNKLVARHQRTFDKNKRIEFPGHIERLLQEKSNAKKHRAIDRLRAMVPSSEEFLKKAAERGHILGRLTQDLTRELELYGSEELEHAIKECLIADRLHYHAVSQALEVRRSKRGLPPPVPLIFDSSTAAAKITVAPRPMDVYDKLLDTAEEEKDV